MIAYFVHDADEQTDTIVIPEIGCAVPVDAKRFAEFIGPKPDFCNWTLTACQAADPESLGTVIAHREETEDICIRDADLWQKRMAYYMG